MINNELKAGLQVRFTAALEVRGVSQNQAAKQIGISASYVNQIIHGQLDPMSDAVWRKLAHWLGVELAAEWATYETPNLVRIQKLCAHAQSRALCRGIAAYAGAGKSTGLRYYQQSNAGVSYVLCDKYMARPDFLAELMRAIGLGIHVPAWTIAEKMDMIAEKLITQHKPLVIIDEADKLRDESLMLMNSLFNHTEGRCAIIMAGTEYFKVRVERGIKWQKQGYDEFSSRLGRTFLELKKVDRPTVKMLCEQNGITETARQNEIANACEDYRQVRAMIVEDVYARQQEDRRQGHDAYPADQQALPEVQGGRKNRAEDGYFRASQYQI